MASAGRLTEEERRASCPAGETSAGETSVIEQWRKRAVELKRVLAKGASIVRRAKLRGDKYRCPLCERGYSRFPGGMCPGCGSYDRHRILWLYLLHLREEGCVKLAGRMVHVAPESGLARQFKRHFDYLSVDLGPGRAMETADVTRLRFPGNHFDAIVCNHVLEHVPDDRRAMSELYRVLKPGGWASLHVPLSGLPTTDEDANVTDPQERLRRFGQEDHVRLYGWDYLTRLSEVGFRVQVITWDRFLKADESQRYAATEDEVILGWKDGTY